ncbi:LPS-assembly protein LptD [Desulfurispira natronophila]|uniref:LPS-assembly protein n=1 Tax=Desulfurispira natronophila TaxID=682562 RepID=A0A7W8DHD9_9BACT|nr:putative LPS assembly protein LptD [Desulfurispira natronophila]MBB5022188.1 LPS-assembly protein [Desulfurispira natronophila]
MIRVKFRLLWVLRVLFMVLVLSATAWAQQITLYADSLTRNFAEGIVEARGNVVVITRDYHIEADEAYYNHEEHSLHLQGNVVLVSNQHTLHGSEITLDTRGYVGDVSCATLNFSERHVLTSDRLRKTGPDTYAVEKAEFTACAGAAIPWVFRMSEATVTEEEYLRARHVRFHLHGVPVLYMPYLVYPVKTKRHSGFLVPGLSLDQAVGVGVANTYYHVLGDQADASIFMNIYTRTGLLLGGEVRYRDHEHGDFFVSHRRINESNTTVDDRRRYRTYASYSLRRNNWSFDALNDRVSDMDFVEDYLVGSSLSGRVDVDGEYHLYDNNRYQSQVALTYENNALAATLLRDDNQQYSRSATSITSTHMRRSPQASLYFGRQGSSWQTGGQLRVGEAERESLGRTFTRIPREEGVERHDLFDRYRARYIFEGDDEPVISSVQYANLEAFLAKPLSSRYIGFELRTGVRGDGVRQPQTTGNALPPAFEDPSDTLWYQDSEDSLAYVVPFAQARLRTAEPSADFGSANHRIRFEVDFDVTRDPGHTRFAGEYSDFNTYFSVSPMSYRQFDDRHTHTLLVPRLVNSLRYGRSSLSHELSRAYAPTSEVERTAGDVVSKATYRYGGFSANWDLLYDPKDEEALRQQVKLAYTMRDRFTLSTEHRYTRYRGSEKDPETPGVDNNTLALEITAIPRWTLEFAVDYMADEFHFRDSIRELETTRKRATALFEDDCAYWLFEYREDRTKYEDQIDTTLSVSFGIRL